MSAPCTSEKEFCESELVQVWAGEVHRILGSRNPEIPRSRKKGRSHRVGYWLQMAWRRGTAVRCNDFPAGMNTDARRPSAS